MRHNIAICGLVGIRYFELFDNGCQNNASSFLTFQKHLRRPWRAHDYYPGKEEGFPSYMWQGNGCVVIHRVQERFGPQRLCK